MKPIYPEILPKSGTTKQLIVLLHGLGSNGHDLISIAPFMQESLPDAHFFAPHGIETYDLIPSGYQWFSLKERDPVILQKELNRVKTLIMELIQQKQRELHLSNKNTILVGFSQGAMTAAYLTLSQNQPFAATIGFSGAVVMPQEISCTGTPICLVHGTKDIVVAYDLCIKSCEELRSSNINAEYYLIENLAHTIDIKGINIATSFINRFI